MLLDFCFLHHVEDIFSWNWGRKAVEDVTSTGHCEAPSSLRAWRGGQGSPGSQLSRPLQTPPPTQKGLAPPEGTARGSCSLLRSQSPETPSSLYPPPLSTDRSLLPVCEPSAHLLVPGLIPIAVHSHPHPHRNKPSQTQQPKTTQICYLAVLDVRSSKCTLLS